MFDVSFVELLVIGVIALLVIGPERLPGVARTVGLWVGKARAMVMDVKADIDRELREDELRRKLGLDGLDKDTKALEDLKKILEESVDKDERTDYLVKAIDAQRAADQAQESQESPAARDQQPDPLPEQPGAPEPPEQRSAQATDSGPGERRNAAMPKPDASEPPPEAPNEQDGGKPDERPR